MGGRCWWWVGKEGGGGRKSLGYWPLSASADSIGSHPCVHWARAVAGDAASKRRVSSAFLFSVSSAPPRVISRLFLC